MCGICGFAGFRNDNLLKRMAASILHRGPDGQGLFTAAEASMGMRRLAIIDLSTGDQPIYNEDRTIAVVFNGEIYNFQELRRSLETRGHRFYTRTDTEVIVHLYEEYGDDCPLHLRGMFAFSIWDSRKKRLFIARDHVGIKPLYYARTAERLWFGSEIKCILQDPSVPRDHDHRALDHFFTLMYIPAPLSAYTAIRKLPPGHRLSWENGRTTISRYWDVPRDIDHAPHPDSWYSENILSLLSASVTEQKIADVPLGVYLSGGIDSSAVVALLSESVSTPVKTFSIGYGSIDPTYDETAKARLVARHFNCEHFEHIVKPDAAATIPKLVDFFDEPFADSSSLPNYFIAQEVRKQITVALTGIGGDELFGGYPRYLGARVAGYYEHLPLHLRRLAARAAHRLPESTRSRNTAGWAKRFTRGSLMPFRERYLSWIMYLSEQEKGELYTPAFRAILSDNYAPGPGFMEGLTDPDGICPAEIMTYLTDDLLCLGDRMSMAHSLELRVPFLDTRLIEFMSRVPLSVKTRGFAMKRLLKNALRAKLPPEILAQKKMGFQVPIGRWINDEINPMIAELLSPRRVRDAGLFDPVMVSRMIDEHRTGRRNATDLIYAMLVFELWRSKQSSAALPQPVAAPAIAPQPEQPKNLLLVNIGGIGDIVMMTPVISAIKAAYPACHISLLTIPRSLEMARRINGINEFFTIPMRYRVPSPLLLWQLLRTLWGLRTRHFDVLINLREVQTDIGMVKMRWLTGLIAPHISVGRNINGRGSFYSHPVTEKFSENRSEVDLTMRLLEPLHIEHPNENFITFPVLPHDRVTLREKLAALNINDTTQLIGLNPGAFRPSRRWPAAHWQELIRLIAIRYPDAIMIVTGENAELSFARSLAVNDRVTLTNGQLTMGELAALCERSKIFITNDTGSMHLAAAVGAPVVAIFGPGDVRRFAPAVPAERIRIVRKEEMSCERPCYRFSCENPVCLTAITPSDVMDAVRSLAG